MIPERWVRSALDTIDVEGAIVVNDVRDAAGRVAIARGTRLVAGDREQLGALDWECLHVVRAVSDSVGEAEAGMRLARACAGDGVDVGDGTGGHWSLGAARRGMVAVRVDALEAVNAIDGLAVYTLPGEQVVERGDVVARAKILPFLVPAGDLHLGEATAAGGVVSVLEFTPRRVSVVVQETLGSSALDRFLRSLEEKVAWFGGSLGPVQVVAPDESALASALTAAVEASDLVVVAGTKAMDPLDPAFRAIARVRGTVERIGAPAHPGSLIWLARVASVPVIGMPSCGLFSRATVFDLALARVFADLPVDAGWLTGLGHGGLLTRDMSWRFPPYRPRAERGAVD